MLHHIGVGPYLLLGIAWQHTLCFLAVGSGILLDAVVHPVVVITSGPRRFMARGTAHLHKQLLAPFHLCTVQIACSRHSQSSVPHHEVVVILSAHLFLSIIGSTLQEVLFKGLLIVVTVQSQQCVHLLCHFLAGACPVGIEH